MMKRIAMLLSVVALMVVMLAMSVTPASAHLGEKDFAGQAFGPYISGGNQFSHQDVLQSTDKPEGLQYGGGIAAFRATPVKPDGVTCGNYILC